MRPEFFPMGLVRGKRAKQHAAMRQKANDTKRARRARDRKVGRK